MSPRTFQWLDKLERAVSNVWKLPGRAMSKIAPIAVIFIGQFVCAESFIPDGRVNPDNYTVLMAVDSQLPADCRPFQAGSHGKFFVSGWVRSDQKFSWEISVPADDEYAVNILACRKKDAPLAAVVSCDGQAVAGNCPAAVNAWDRQTLDGTLKLSAGKHALTLESRSTNFSASVMSVELVRHAVRERLHESALKMRADTTWFRQARYGLMCHWTSQSFPRHGPRKPYAEAVKDFDVQGFADQVKATGAGFLLLTTSHAEMYLPAPVAALDKILPGRTTQRDLIAELADTLGRRGIRLMLYYHLGSVSDPVWLRACGFWETDTRILFANWSAVIAEIGNRYGDKLAGWWFDDGTISYYYRSAPWEELTRAAKAGNAQRLVGYNPWILPAPTEFQDYFCGEGFANPRGDDVHPIGSDGRYTTGSHAGLQAAATLITEGDWGHFHPDREIGKPRWTAEQMAELLRRFSEHKNVPIFNVEIYQEGSISLGTVEMFKRARQLLETKQ